MIFLLAGAFYSFAGDPEQMPERTPKIIDNRELCADQSLCRTTEAMKTAWQEVERRERPLRVASYNVHKCTGTDFKRDPDRIAEVIRSLDADIVSLQEVLSDPGDVPSAQVRYIAEKTGMYMAVAGPTKVKKDGRYGNALLSRFPIKEVRLHDISFKTFEPRGIIDADIMIAGLKVRVIATHFGLWPAERNRQTERLLQILPDQPAGPLIVMGDMNGWVPGSPVLRRLTKRLGEPAALRSFPSVLPLLPLDKIWVLPAEHLHEAKAHRTKLTSVASDHVPVTATVYLPGLLPANSSASL